MAMGNCEFCGNWHILDHTSIRITFIHTPWNLVTLSNQGTLLYSVCTVVFSKMDLFHKWRSERAPVYMQLN
jgi:hypothetical protein